MAFFVTLILWAATFILSELLKPKPNIENARPAGLGDFAFPTATEDRTVPLVWGTVKIDGPNVVWYGDLIQEPITVKVKTGIFSSEQQITGYKYHIGVQMALCRGEVDKLLNIWVGDTILWTGTQSGAGTVSIDLPEFLGGQDLGQGGMIGDIAFAPGSATQAVSTYLSAFQQQGGDTPRYNDTCYVTYEGGYIGNSTSIKPWKFEIQRIPNGLSLADPTVNTYDANLMNVLYELLTNDDWGFGYPSADVDTTELATQAEVLRLEGNGFSSEFLKILEKQMDGVVYLDRVTGKWTINLARGGYVLADQPQLDDSNIKEVADFSRGSWSETSTEVRGGYTNRANDYFSTFAMAQDMANQKIQGGQNIVAQVRYPGVMDSDLANQLVWRDLRGLSRPLGKARVIVGREFYNLNPGDVVSFTNTALEITDLAMRVIRVDLGTLTEGKIELSLVEDIFTFEDPTFAAPIATNWTAPDNTAVDITAANRVIFEAPKAFVDRDPLAPGQYDRIWCGGRTPGSGAVIYKIDAGGTEVGKVAGFLFAAELTNAVNPENHGGNIEISMTPDTEAAITAQLADATDADIGASLANICLINNEFISFKTFTDLGSTLRLDNVYRGLCDTVPGIHASTDRVWLLFVRGGLTTDSFASTPISIKLLTQTNTETLASGSATATSVTMASRHLKPYPPSLLQVHSSTFPAGSQSLDTAVVATDDGKGLKINWTRRDFRASNEVDSVTDEGSLTGDFPTVNTTEYKTEVINDPTGAATVLYDTGWVTGGAAEALLSRTEILRYTAGVIPSTLQIKVYTRHTVDAVVIESAQQLIDNVTVASSELAGQTNGGALNDSDVWALYSSDAPDSGTYAFAIGSDAIPATYDVEARINGGAWASVIASGSTSGNLAGVTALDSVDIRHTGVGAGTAQTILTVTPPTASTIGYAILII